MSSAGVPAPGGDGRGTWTGILPPEPQRRSARPLGPGGGGLGRGRAALLGGGWGGSRQRLRASGPATHAQGALPAPPLCRPWPGVGGRLHTFVPLEGLPGSEGPLAPLPLGPSPPPAAPQHLTPGQPGLRNTCSLRAWLLGRTKLSRRALSERVLRPLGAARMSQGRLRVWALVSELRKFLPRPVGAGRPRAIPEPLPRPRESHGAPRSPRSLPAPCSARPASSGVSCCAQKSRPRRPSVRGSPRVPLVHAYGGCASQSEWVPWPAPACSPSLRRRGRIGCPWRPHPGQFPEKPGRAAQSWVHASFRCTALLG
ncbi:translation initiation factor IF-2-like [Ailuropoda melanoleuca]|uniref:translation initiation factor IF-2-like n=1 Tax=Ailuropoda melanoleuca TaxID=9646 RepID=UPI0014944A2A|nr:translation initiation factor IF-2-like [Ailuropoda melanoleuca]XP_034523662.1 translation initiation factor IF-2-like [Ailuropoda melanoleuca]XP_034523663.1 translation initiation factor IF-2-like [Ailuropoda melanoleuca]XP_034523664.1 translation initiation factor IF-2-like [Ailuropoda melanoleuca]XP_034523665.1 translation initiation factor IF-2-like [Ailuropoda melanoleuca]XP_034523666.1 translation initiation factor IF-2-like [Ailuropoda melanoleuca]XP_034523667.1 translation initiati